MPITRQVPADFILPAQPIQRDKPPTGPEWVHEIKHDGYRILVRRDGASIRLWSRNAVDFTDRLPAITASASRLMARSSSRSTVRRLLSGQTGSLEFHELRRRDGAKRAMLYAFDLLELDETDLRPRPLLDRKAVLKRLLSSVDSGIVLNEHIVADGAVVFAHACKLGAEGIGVSKRIDAPYRSGRCSPPWIKTKAPAAIAEQRQRSEAWNT